jgi:hypothetical protein
MKKSRATHARRANGEPVTMPNMESANMPKLKKTINNEK